MAQREPRHPTALQGRVTLEPHRGPPDCGAHAYEQSVPGPRRMGARTASAAQREAGHTHQDQGGRRTVS